MKRLLTVEEIADILKVKPLTVRAMFREGRLRGFKIGKAWRTSEELFEQDLERLEQSAATGKADEKTTAPSESPASIKEVKASYPKPTAKTKEKPVHTTRGHRENKPKKEKARTPSPGESSEGQPFLF